MKPKLEHIPHELDGSIHAFIYENDYFNAPWHYHEDYELTYIVKGSGIRHVGNNIDHFTPNDLVLIGKEVPHCWRNEMGYNDGVISVCVQWNNKTIDDFLNNNSELQAVHSLLEASKQGIKFTNIDFVKQISDRMIQLNQLHSGKKLINLLDILLDLATSNEKTLLSITKTNYHFTEKSNTRIASILNYIDHNYHRKISIEDMANLIYMTNSAFCKYFKKEFKRPFTNYLNEFRIRKACLLLQETDQNLLDIALNCGYENMSFFHRQFKKYLLMTPLAYRNYNALFE
ncbi:AraC family transcriptional regulator [Algibacter sp. 2305UL17-15]|uniref:AraC family transcriptional regulator n=1 Tax=Algibacter sp. 2305UL17-15 TaxID=3231268 RepID=UPI0034580B94